MRAGGGIGDEVIGFLCQSWRDAEGWVLKICGGMMMGNDDDDDEAKWNWRGSGVFVGRGSRGGVGMGGEMAVVGWVYCTHTLYCTVRRYPRRVK